jgi:hypothetical protein
VTVAGLIAASALGIFVLGASAQTQKYRAPWWPPIVNTGPTVSESYSDIPWHQKLGTFAGNELDEAIVLPYAALPSANTDWCTSQNLSQARCMIETGINSIITVARTDTLYDWVNDPKMRVQNAKRCDVPSPNAGPPRCNKVIPYCQNPSTPGSVPCIEVNLEISMYWNRGSNALVPRPYGNENKKNQNPPVYDSGLVFTDGTVFAPQMPWYMSHYCFSATSGPANTVCDDDYFTTINNGFNKTQGDGDGNNDGWPNANAPWSVYPNAASQQSGPGLTGPNHCAQTDPMGNQLTKCTMVLAGFDLYPVTGPQAYNGQFLGFNATLFDDAANGGGKLGWFNNALKNFPTDLGQDVQHHFPWLDTQLSWANQVYPQAILSPFQGQYAITAAGGPTPADHYLYPRKCTLDDLYTLSAAKLRQCGVVYELHPNGWSTQWPDMYQTYIGKPPGANMLGQNQYGRTSFLFAGVPGMQMPVTFYKNNSPSTLSIYEQVHNASLFSLYLPIANEADIKWAETGRNYTDLEFYHTLLMTNHMEQDQNTFAEGIRGRTLWHNEYRSQVMYATRNNFSPSPFPDVMFPAAFTAATAKAPYHNYTCDGCHVRNGSGIPTNPLGKLDPVLQGPSGCGPSPPSPPCFMTAGVYTPAKVPDYTFTGVIEPMKLVFFDLKRTTSRNDPSVYSKPEEGGKVAAWANKIMNFYGDSFRVTNPNFTYSWSYGKADANRLVVSTQRINSELNYEYVPQQVNLGEFKPFQNQGSPCIDGQGGTIVLPTPRDSLKAYWPQSCAEINGAAIAAATKDGGDVGFMLLNGKRLGNLGAIEAIPNGAVLFIQKNQMSVLGSVSMINGTPISPPIPRYGQILWTAGTRGGVGRPNVPVPGSDQKLNCTTQTSLDFCWIGRFGWLGDRVSLEDQVANAAFIEMNMTTSQGYTALYGSTPVQFPVRYNLPNCGPADRSCVNSKGNGELLETDINRMADYARWLGDPTRSEFTVSLPEVVAGEQIFRNLNCNQCHVIGKIPIANPNDTLLTPVYRARLATHMSSSGSPYLSYLGTDLLMHDMGYLSQVGVRTAGIRDPDSGVVLPGFENYVQKIRTPALKGLRFNRFVTDSHNNTISKSPPTPACDFLLHDGRACDAIEAAFLHDGPAIKALNVIGAKGKGGLNDLSPLQIQQLRAFLYSL